MRGGVAAAALLLAVLVTAPVADARPQPEPIGTSMRVTATPNTAGAHARLKLTLRYVMQCRYPGAGALVVKFPAALKLPSRFAAGSVRLGGKAIAAKIRGQRVTVTIPPPTGTLCGTVGPGLLVLTFARSAKLVNPTRAGSYAFKAMHAPHAFAGTLAIRAAS